MADEGCLLIHRPRQFADRVRRYRIFVDKEFVATISAGASVEIERPPDGSTITAKMDWVRSNSVSVHRLEPGQQLEVRNRMGWRMWLPFAMLYYITFGRSRYLQLSIRDPENDE